MIKKLNPARILEIHESLVDLPHDIIKMCRSLSGKPNHHNLQSPQRNLILQNCYSKSFKTKRSQKSSQTCHFNSTFVINRYFTDFFANENPRKFVEKQNMIFFYIFHAYLDTSKRTITQGTSAPEDFLPRGNFGQKIFPQEAFVQERPSLPRRHFFQEDVYLFGTIVQRHLCNKEHPMAKYLVWSRVLTKQKSDTW